ncbi:MAG: NAD-dependent deacylase [Anaerolineae bacterium]|nr:NAD-dependent deacylase [Anaerolineae bacterium]
MTVDRALIEQAAQLLRGCARLAVLTGAGISKESGVPTFRDAMDGLWARYDPQELATPQAFARNPKLVYDWYTYRRELVAGAAPNPGHYALVDLEPLIPEVTIITQNVDGFHRAAGSRTVIELHGSLGEDRCSANCRGAPTLVKPGAALPAAPGEPPRCPYCRSFLRPNVVWFNEALPVEALERAMQVSRSCDVMLVVGTSGVVQPAASLPYWAVRSGAKLIDVNPGMDEIGPAADVFLQGPSGEVLPQLVDALRTPA